MAFKLFGLQFGAVNDPVKPEAVVRSFVNPENDDGAKDFGVNNLAGAFSYALDLDKAITNQSALINEYRNTSMIPDVDLAIEDIINESIISDENAHPVRIVLDDVPLSAGIKKKIEDEFEFCMQLLRFPGRAHDIFKRWYVDGQINYHKLIDETAPENGIQELRFVDPRNLIKVREFQQPNRTEAEFITLKSENYVEYFVYSEMGFNTTPTTVGSNTSLMGIKIAKDSIAHCNSGMIDPNSKLIMSHVHKAVRIARQLRMLEDSMIINRVSRAPERRVFYIDIGNLPKGRAEQYMQSIIAKYKNKLTYDANTGELRDERRHLSITEDFWIPRRDGSVGTKVETLPGADNLGEINDVIYFQERLYNALNVPVSRLNPETMMVLGKANETTRDEVKYTRWIARIRTRFTILFDDLLGTQLRLKNIVDQEEWDAIRSKIRYDYLRDNFFTELSENEILMTRLEMLGLMQPFVGKYWSEDWIKKNLLKQDQDDIDQIAEQNAKEQQFNLEQKANTIQTAIDLGLMPDPNDPAVQDQGGVPSQQQANIFGEDAIPTSADELMKALVEETRQRMRHRRNLKALPGTTELE